jgi:uncharacterized protein YebE (UPF0316 family)
VSVNVRIYVVGLNTVLGNISRIWNIWDDLYSLTA